LTWPGIVNDTAQAIRGANGRPRRNPMMPSPPALMVLLLNKNAANSSLKPLS
jgi:hypothetical protein